MKEGSPTISFSPEWVRQLKEYGLMSALAVTTFLASCGDGPKKQASSIEIKNHIENPDFEKSPEGFVEKIESELKKHPHGYNFRITGEDYYEYGADQNDSTVILNNLTILGRAPDPEKIRWSVAIDKQTGVIASYTESKSRDSAGAYESRGLQGSGLYALYAVLENGKVEIKGKYVKGQAVERIEEFNSKLPVSEAIQTKNHLK